MVRAKYKLLTEETTYHKHNEVKVMFGLIRMLQYAYCFVRVYSVIMLLNQSTICCFQAAQK